MIIPAIDVLDGAVVRLKRGDFNRKMLYRKDPVSLVRAYADSGADLIHIVDLSGAKNPGNRQFALIESMMKGANVRLQVGGGVRTIADIVELLNAGASRVVVGSVAIESPDKLAKWCQTVSPEKILPAIDVKADTKGVYSPVTRGWTRRGPADLETLLRTLVDTGFGEVLMTDVRRDGMLSGPNVELYQRLASSIPGLRFQASGGVSSIEDIRSLQIPEVTGVIVGRALLDGLIEINEAIAC